MFATRGGPQMIGEEGGETGIDGALDGFDCDVTSSPRVAHFVFTRPPG